jgi:PadR family transcriptional regulator PadR
MFHAANKPNKQQPMKIENSKAQMKKGVLEYCILAIIDKKDCYASEIIHELKEAKMIVVEGTLYPLLTRQKNAGLLSYRWEESRQGPPRKYYTLTEKGKNHLRELDGSWKELQQAVAQINQNRNTEQ